MLYYDHFNDTDLDSLYPSDSILLYRVSRLRSVIEAGDGHYPRSEWKGCMEAEEAKDK